MTFSIGFRSLKAALVLSLALVPAVTAISRVSLASNSVELASTPISPANEQLKADLERRAVQYFIEASQSVTGQTLDKAENFTVTPADNRMASIAATGFSLASIVNAGLRGMVTPAFAQDYALKTLRFARDHVPRRNGWFTHFYDWETGVAYVGSEFSTIDTALFMGGAMYAAAIYPNTEIASIVHQLYVDMDYIEMMTDAGAKPAKRTLSMAYFPGLGYTPAQWDMPAEQTLLYLMGVGHPTKPLPVEAWFAWRRDTTLLANGKKLIGADMPLFVHQYSQLFVDFAGKSDGFGNYFDNGKVGSEFNRESSLRDNRFQTFRDGFWGISAGLTPDGYAAPGPITNSAGTVCIGCAAGSAMYMPHEVLNDVQTWINGQFGPKIYGRYGLVDSINIDRNWFATEVLGITVGPVYMSLANMNEDTSFWKVYRQIPELQRAFQLIAR